MNKFLHFSNVNTSKVGRAHAALKSISRCRPYTGKMFALRLILLCLILWMNWELQLVVVPLKYGMITRTFFAGVVQSVSRYASVKFHEQMLLLDEATVSTRFLWGLIAPHQGYRAYTNFRAEALGHSTSFRWILCALAPSACRVVNKFTNLVPGSG